MMLARIQNRYDYTGYIKCGEILRPPCESTTRPYALKCFYCKEIYLLFEAFIFHIEDHCKNAIAEMEQDANSTKSHSLDQANKKPKEKYLTSGTEEDKDPLFMQTVEGPSAVITSGSKSDDNQNILAKTELNPSDNTEASRCSTPLRSKSQLKNNCSSKKLPRHKRTLEKCTNNTTKTTKVARTNVRAYKARKPSRRVLKNDNDDFEFDNINEKTKVTRTNVRTYTARKPSKRVLKNDDDPLEFNKVNEKTKAARTNVRTYTARKSNKRVLKNDNDDLKFDNVNEKPKRAWTNVRTYTARKPKKPHNDELELDNVNRKTKVTGDDVIKTDYDELLFDKDSKNTKVAIDNIKTYIAIQPNRQIVKTEKHNELEIESSKMKAEQQSNVNTNFKAIDHNFESYPVCMKEEPENNTDEYLLSDDEEDAIEK